MGKLEQTNTPLDPYLPTGEETPEYADLYNSWGNILYDLNQVLAAQAKYQQAIQLNGTQAAFQVNLGNVFLKLNQATKAIDCFKAAIELDPKYEYAYTGWGSALGKLEQTDTPLDPYLPTDEETPEYADLYNGWGVSLYQRNQFLEAQTKVQQAIQLNDTQAVFQVNLGYLLGINVRRD